ncbi:MAG TPA: 5'-deoxyadenosine deaminase [Caldithrix abyssi]|uniref:5'-deoxyadenosine deaminase n=1 Tax=Caldithrix abyssi TaxID=187145 RepID=A0A7V4TYB2_CALAY|nr:5'-deoxyadenosine deaminase [Caldithrix abyssi]
MTQRILIKNGLVVTMNRRLEVVQADILIDGRHIKKIAPDIEESAAEVFDATGYIITPGFIQTHVHLCQALFRNLADDLSLLDWLEKKIWPYEGRHTPETLRLSARLGLAELIRSGTTTIMDMGTVHHQQVIFEELAASGIRAFAGKTMMDYGELPTSLKENTRESLDTSVMLLKEWHNYDEGRLRYAFAPRFALSCSDDLLVETGWLAREYDTVYHTHASENKDEVELVRQRFGVNNVMLFEKLGLAGSNLCLAHCIWTDEEERALLKEKNIKVLHCPSANLKLGSGVAPVPDYLQRGITVSLGADGAPCNNHLDAFNEMRLAALIQKPLHGPQSMTAEQVFNMATLGGAATLGIENETGSLEENKLADMIFIKDYQVHSIPYENVFSKLVYSAHSGDVQHVMVNGRWLMRDRQILFLDEQKLVHEVQKTIPEILNT